MQPRWKAVLFDAGNTLIHVDYGRVSSFLARHGVACDAALLGWAELRARRVLDTAECISRTKDRDRWGSYFDLICEHAGVGDASVRALVLEQLRAEHLERNLWNRLTPSAHDVLKDLKGRGYRVGMVSNSDGSIQALADQLGLTPYLEVIVDSHVVGVEKPDPRIFKIALEQMKDLKPADCLYVGDLYHVDVAGAKQAGLSAALLDPADLHTGKGCLRIRTLEELLDVVA